MILASNGTAYVSIPSSPDLETKKPSRISRILACLFCQKKQPQETNLVELRSRILAVPDVLGKVISYLPLSDAIHFAHTARQCNALVKKYFSLPPDASFIHLTESQLVNYLRSNFDPISLGRLPVVTLKNLQLPDWSCKITASNPENMPLQPITLLVENSVAFKSPSFRGKNYIELPGFRFRCLRWMVQWIRTGNRGKGPFRTQDLQALEAGTDRDLFQHTINLNPIDPYDLPERRYDCPLLFLNCFAFGFTALLYALTNLSLHNGDRNPDETQKSVDIIKIVLEAFSALLALQILSL